MIQLFGQSQDRMWSMLGRGELDFRGGLGSQSFEMGLVRFLTSLRIKTDWGACILIPATMRLQSLELYAPVLHLSAEEEAWAERLTDLCIMTAELLYDIRNGPPGYASLVQVAGSCLCISIFTNQSCFLRPKCLIFIGFKYTSCPDMR